MKNHHHHESYHSLNSFNISHLNLFHLDFVFIKKKSLSLVVKKCYLDYEYAPYQCLQKGTKIKWGFTILKNGVGELRKV
jgi:hypothetical protein